MTRDPLKYEDHQVKIHTLLIPDLAGPMFFAEACWNIYIYIIYTHTYIYIYVRRR